MRDAGSPAPGLGFRMPCSAAASSIGSLKSKPGHLRAAPGQRQREVARAAAEVQRALPGLRAGQLDHAPFPIPVQAKTLEIIDQVVARRDAGEELVHLRGALVARIKECVGHG